MYPLKKHLHLIFKLLLVLKEYSESNGLAYLSSDLGDDSLSSV